MSHIHYRYLLPALLVMTGCASFDIDQSTQKLNQQYPAYTQGKLALASKPEQQKNMQDQAASLLTQPLSQDAAVQLALLNSPALQAMLAQHQAAGASTAQSARITNPLFTFERNRQSGELELGRLLSFGLMDLLSLPQRQTMAQHSLAQAQTQLSLDVIDSVSQVRIAWVKAVAAQQSLEYARQVGEAAGASAILAERMHKAGNFNSLQAARQLAFKADAVAQLSFARHASLATREELVRLLGLNDEQEKTLKLPERLPDLPATPLAAESLGPQASKNRLDIQLAKQELDAAAARQGLSLVSSFTDIELGIRRDTNFDAAGHGEIKRGVEVSLRLPLFDWGDAQRTAMNANTLAASYRLQATVNNAGSHLRVSYSAYRNMYDIARQYRDEILPLRKRISVENQLRYNGMFISVFELLADSREQINSVLAAINAEQQFWLADAALQAELLGRPSASNLNPVKSTATAEAAH
ncbi:copper resistance-related lipoprotein [Undibacterium sp. YM2]|uniref:TolC family protein n=1 Tax=Undibacterium sp. YM2 TaxID=2058625 RepID=UPI001331EEC7|nr:TolC family protein [Undibacterium sp. YM2]BBB67755.1 copper resistance-related lipoprotein [Undibacterium sp. YM2]